MSAVVAAAVGFLATPAANATNFNLNPYVTCYKGGGLIAINDGQVNQYPVNYRLWYKAYGASSYQLLTNWRTMPYVGEDQIRLPGTDLNVRVPAGRAYSIYTQFSFTINGVGYAPSEWTVIRQIVNGYYLNATVGQWCYS